MNEKLLTVIIPVYNEEKYLQETINSVVTQSYQNLEIIIIDDGSTDSSPQICDYYASIDKRIKVIHQDNGGMISARYAGIKRATGEYVIFIDGDDFISPEMYKKLMKFAEEYDADMIGGGAIRYRAEDDFTKDICYEVPEGLYEEGEIEQQIYPRMLWDNKNDKWAVDPSLCMKVIRRDILLKQYKKIHEFSFSYGEDSAVIYPAILDMKKIYLSHECYYYHRKRDVNVVAPYLLSENYLEQLLTLYKYLHECFSKVPIENNLIMQLDMFYINSVNYLIRRYPQIKKSGIEKQYLFPYDEVKKGSKIVLYGAGKIGKQYWNQIGKIHYFEDVLWVDKDYKNAKSSCVTDISNVDAKLYDYIIIAIKSTEICGIVSEKLNCMGWREDQIIVPKFDQLAL